MKPCDCIFLPDGRTAELCEMCELTLAGKGYADVIRRHHDRARNRLNELGIATSVGDADPFDRVAAMPVIADSISPEDALCRNHLGGDVE